MHSAHAIADRMGTISAACFYTTITVETKTDDTFVTQADKKTEQAARDYLAQHRPTDKIWGEEFGRDFTNPYEKDITWVIDPIDGTKAYMDGLAYWTNLLAVFHGTTLLLGIINQPITRERYWGGPNFPSRYAYVDAATERRVETPMHCVDISGTVQLVWRSTTKDYMDPNDRKAFDALAKISTPREGGDSMLYASLARGRTLNCVYDGDLAPWDIAGPAAVVLGAGGVVTNANGAPLEFFRNEKTTVLAAATMELHAAVLAILRSSKQ